MKLLRTLALASILSAATAGTSSAASLMWVIENQSDTVYTVDVTTLTATLVGNAGVDVRFGGLGFAQNGNLYAWSTNLAGGGALYLVNQTTGALTVVASSTLFGGDTFDINPLTNEAIVWSADGSLNDVNLGTGATSFRVNTSPLSSGVDSAFGNDGTYYQMTPVGSNVLNRVNTTTGVVTTIGNTGLNITATNLSFNPDDGMLYAIAVLDPLFPLYRINPLTGAGVFVGNITGLGNNPAQQISMGTFNVAGAAAAVPEPATMLLLGGGLAAGVARRVRRR
jgi:hypothetical protein